MIPYLHTKGGDNLLFKSWTPLSHDAIAGASVVLFFLAILERLVNGVRGRLEGYWASNALRRYEEHVVEDDNTSCSKLESPSLPNGSKLILAPRRRIMQPFILAHDLPRGIIYMFQATITYTLMLGVMSFHAGYFVSIIVGLGVGEVIFGRWALATHH
ncbi:hypothetical protein BDM02DRAFT_1374107 [Thelephora ganbajun]|uniref:Uncharacterized protein n=1 Tax=Thelephora ganbajun TaxID=370292 RepID=A0ACB6Z3E0_THEGA|nr:hypothetical protein BDM02DRAFT_1374107 [Thelephora ganbajun]